MTDQEEITAALASLHERADRIDPLSNAAHTIRGLAGRYGALAPEARACPAPAAAPSPPLAALVHTPDVFSEAYATQVYAARKAMLRPATHSERPETSPSAPAPASGDQVLDATAIYARRKAAVGR